jgi:hypothetical protein
MIHILNSQDFKTVGKCFIANALDVAESAIRLLSYQSPLDPVVCQFLRVSLGTKTLKDKYVAAPQLKD